MTVAKFDAFSGSRIHFNYKMFSVLKISQMIEQQLPLSDRPQTVAEYGAAIAANVSTCLQYLNFICDFVLRFCGCIYSLLCRFVNSNCL